MRDCFWVTAMFLCSLLVMRYYFLSMSVDLITGLWSTKAGSDSTLSIITKSVTGKRDIVEGVSDQLS